jgi:hypothetical protein
MSLKSKPATDFTANSFDQATIKHEGLMDLFTRLHSTGSIRATPCIGESKGRKPRDTALEISQLNRARIPYGQFSSYWFVHAGKPWPVKDCPTDVIKSALRNRITSESAQELLKSSNFDLVARWYLCCEVSTFRLFKSKEEAMRSMEIDDNR